MMEVWQDIKGYEGLYQISTLGRVKSLERSNKYKSNKEIIMKNLFDGRYAFIRLCKNNKKRNILIHRLVAEHFIKKTDDKNYVNHINGNKLDNKVDNLEWVTASENTQHAHDNNLIKLPNKRIIQIDDNGKITHWESIKEASITLGISRSNIGSCCNGKRNKAGNYRWQFEGGI